MATKAKFYADLGLQSELNTQIDGDLTVSGDLTVTGTTVTVNSTVTSVGDSMMELANQNTSTDLLDIGFYGNYNDGIGSESGVSEFTGLFRDASDSTWKLFDGLEAEPTTTVNTSGTNYALADLILGDLTSSTLTAASLTYPTSDGSANQVLTTNGSGALSFADSGALSSGTLTTTSTSATNLDSIAITSYRGAKYSISISDATGSDYQITEVHVIHDGTNASISQFGTVLQGGSTELGTFTVDIDSGNLRLRVASATTNSTVYKYKRLDHSV
jgi:hypothetical protein